MIDLVINNNTLTTLDFDNDFDNILTTTMKILAITDDIELSCNFVDEKTIRKINRENRKIDRVTDVISFAMEDSEQFYVAGMPREIGDIFICVERAKEQAEEYGHSERREICFLFTHGLLHLLGYDHMNVADEKVMTKLQRQILEAVAIGR